MQLPIDIKGLFDAVTDINAARETELSVSLYVDGSAPAELVAHVRGTFASTDPTVRMAILYLDGNFAPNPDDDIAIVVAGDSLKVGAAAAAIRGVGVPVMVATLSPAAVVARAEGQGNAIPDGDVVAPCAAGEAAEPMPLDDAAALAIDENMGRWIVAVCHDKRLAFAIAFPFMRKPLAVDSIQATSLQNAGIGLVPFIPGADLPIMTLNQAKMALQIAAAYGHDMDKNRLKELAVVIGGAYLSRALVRELAEFVPVLGFAIRTGVAYGATSAMGHAIVEYYEGGENVAGVANVASSATEAGSKLVSKARAIIADPSSVDIVSKVGGYASTVRDKAEDAIPRFVDAATGIVMKAVSR